MLWNLRTSSEAWQNHSAIRVLLVLTIHDGSFHCSFGTQTFIGDYAASVT